MSNMIPELWSRKFISMLKSTKLYQWRPPRKKGPPNIVVGRWVLKHILKVPTGARCPKWFLWLFRPIFMFYATNTKIRWDFESDAYVIEGLRFSRHDIDGIKWAMLQNNSPGEFYIDMKVQEGYGWKYDDGRGEVMEIQILYTKRERDTVKVNGKND
jgi:hypothetical protein